MMSLSQSVGYAIRGMAEIESLEGDKVFVRDIAERAGVPPAYLAKLFKRLKNAGILETKRGWAGGTRLARPADAITLLEISEAIDGREWMNRCLLGLEECSDERSCPTHDFWKSTRRAIEEKLRKTTLANVIEFQAGYDRQMKEASK